MKIGLIDVDSHNFPNLALMKISNYHKSKGDEVSFCEFLGKYDKVYASKVFTFSKDFHFIFFADEIIYGGTGYDITSALPPEIEAMTPDYSLYNQFDYAVGYLTRGCPRNCPFCIVGKKEGFKSVQVANIQDFWKGQKVIKLLDPNLTANKNRIDLFKQLKDTGAMIDFTQGLDIRFMTDSLIEIVKDMRIKMFHFAYDMMEQKELIEKNLINFKNKTGYKRSKVSVFVLINFNTTFEEDIYRINFIRNLNFQPYVMIYEKEKIKAKTYHKKLQRWVNWIPFFWKIKTFDEYLEFEKTRQTNRV